MVVVDAVTRLIPGAVGDSESTVQESFATGLLEYAQYTRPPVFRGEEVPPVLLSGNHEAVRQFRQEQSVELTRNRRPDLFRAFAGEREPVSQPNPDTKEKPS